MSDLRAAVEAEIAAHTPAVVPSFDALRARRTRQRRTRSAAGVLLAAAAAGMVAVPAMVIEDDRLTGGLAAAATADGANPLRMTADGIELARTGTAQMSGAYTDPEDATALFVHAGRSREAGHCADYAAVRVVEQDDTTVTLDGDSYAPVTPLPPGQGCGLVLPPPAQHRLDLGVPLDGRRVVDMEGDELTVLDSGTLLVPTAVPPGYRLPGTLTIGAGMGDTSNEVTLHTYAGPDSGTQIELYQGRPDRVPGSDDPVPPAVVLDRAVVRGSPAVVTQTAGFDDLTCLQWRESPDHEVGLCSRGAPAPLSSGELQAVAASLRAARDAGDQGMGLPD